MDPSRTAIRLLMAELATARRAMAHGDTDGARRALDAALAIDAENVQALDWRAELDRVSPQPAPPPPVRPAPLAAGGWPVFEQRIRERRARRRLEAARAALATGDHATAREALDELTLLAPTDHEVIALQRELARTAGDVVAAPAPAVPGLVRVQGPPPGPPKGGPHVRSESRPQVLSESGPQVRSEGGLHVVPVPAAPAGPPEGGPHVREAHSPQVPRVVVSPAFTVAKPPARARWVALSAAAILLAAIGGVLGYTAVKRTREAPSVAAATQEQLSTPARTEATEAVATSEPVSTAGVTGTDPQPPAEDLSALSPEPASPSSVPEPDPAEQEPAIVTPVQRAASSSSTVTSTPRTQNQVRTPPEEPARTPLPGREYPGSTIAMAASAPPQEPVAATPQPSLPDAIGTRTVHDDPIPAASTSLASSNTANAASTSTSASTTPPPSLREAAIAPAVDRVNPTAAAEASVRQLLDRYVRAYNRLDASAAHAIWPGVNKTALERAFAELSAQTLRFDRCTVSVDEEGGTASCSGDARWVPRVGDQGSRRENRTWKFELARNGDEWIITRAEARR